jgi:predicted outer membrane repeat protein
MTPPIRRLVALAASLTAPALVLAFLLFGLPAPAQAANVVVHNCTPGGLRAAIQAAGAGGTVTFACTSGGPTITLTQTQVLSLGVTLDGGSAITLSGGNATRLFSVPLPQKATLLNLTLTLGSASDGGAVEVAGLAVIHNVVFVHNTSAGNGGALAVLGSGTADVSLSRFDTNSAEEGGAIDNLGTLNVDNSNFSGNFAPLGGAIAQTGAAAVATVAASTLTANHAKFGGAIFGGGSFTLAADVFDHNATSLHGVLAGTIGGGALDLAAAGQALVEQSQFFSNSADYGGGVGVGGAVLNQGSLTVLDSLFNQNSAPDDGGAVLSNNSLAITHSTFLRNTSLGEGGAISNTGFITATTSTFVTNTAGVSGGAIANNQRVSLLYSLLFNNQAPNGGAGRNHAAGTLNIFSSTLFSNTALTGAGGALLNTGDGVLVDSTVVANAAPNASGGAVQSAGTAASFGLVSSTVVSNTAASGGAALRQVNGDFALIDSIVAFNSALNCQGAFNERVNTIQFSGLSCGSSITSTNPLLGPLQDNGGPRVGFFNAALPTLLPLSSSPAIDAGILCQSTDERDFPRFGLCDIGAVERVFPLELPLVEK